LPCLGLTSLSCKDMGEILLFGWLDGSFFLAFSSRIGTLFALQSL
jgi:hypothetical protein